MKQIKSKIYLIVSTMILSGLLATQTAKANQTEVTFVEEIQVTDSDLASQSGQGGGISNNAQLSGNVITVNSGGTLSNGNNNIGDHALDNVNGIATVIQNSGNNVVIQNSTVVNVSFQ